MADAMVSARATIHACPVCFNLTDGTLCDICRNGERSSAQLCIVAAVRDVFALERASAFSGRYHVLEGLISPIEGVGPDDLRLSELISRIRTSHTPTTADPALLLREEPIHELILALPPSIEGDTTSLFLSQQIQAQFATVKLTRIAFGLPVGGDLEYADALTLTRALAGRQAL